MKYAHIQTKKPIRIYLFANEVIKYFTTQLLTCALFTRIVKVILGL